MGFNWNLLGYAFCRIWQSQIYAFVTSSGGSEQWMAVLWLAAALALCWLALMLFTRRTIRAARARSIVFSAGASAVGVPLLLVGAFVGVPALFGLSAICSGVGMAFLWFIWADRFSVMSTREICLYTVCNSVVMIAFNLVGNVFPSAQNTTEILLVVAPVASLVLLLRDWKRDGTWSGEGAGQDAGDDAAKKAAPLLGTRNLVGLCVVMFMFPFAYHVSVVSLFPGTSFLGRDGGDIIATLVFALVLVGTKGRVSLVSIYRVVVPLVLAGFLACCLMPVQTAAANALLAGGGLKLASLFFWVLLLLAVPEGKKRWAVLAGGLGARFLGNSAALFLDSSLSFATLDVWNSLVIMAVVIVVLVCVVLWTLPAHPAPQAVSQSSDSKRASNETLHADVGFESRCVAIAEESLLTRREAEVFLLLAQGRNEATIAAKLSIGRGTVHSHILHVYQKTGVHGQQELINLVQGK